MVVRDLGSLEAAAEISGVSHSQLGRYQHVDAPDMIPADKIALLEGQAGVRPHITQTLAAINRHILVPAPPADGDGVWIGRLGELAREAGELMAGLGNALADGAITAREVQALGLRAEVAELQSTLSGIDRALAAIERGEARPKTRPKD